ncbi:MAG: GTP-binding protein of the rab/ypt [Marteilia pararefringens]
MQKDGDDKNSNAASKTQKVSKTGLIKKRDDLTTDINRSSAYRLAGENEIKVVLLGNAYCGKTSLFNRFIYDKFEENEQSTIGCHMKKKLVINEKRKERTIVNLWDTAGSERFSSIAPVYARRSDAVILMFDLTEESSIYVLKGMVDGLLNQLNSDTPKFLVGNKSDLMKSDEDAMNAIDNVSKDMAKILNAKYFKVSARSSEGVQELFQSIATDGLKFQKSIDNDELSDFIDRFRLQETDMDHDKCC